MPVASYVVTSCNPAARSRLTELVPPPSISLSVPIIMPAHTQLVVPAGILQSLLLVLTTNLVTPQLVGSVSCVQFKFENRNIPIKSARAHT